MVIASMEYTTELRGVCSANRNPMINRMDSPKMNALFFIRLFKMENS